MLYFYLDFKYVIFRFKKQHQSSSTGSEQFVSRLNSESNAEPNYPRRQRGL